MKVYTKIIALFILSSFLMGCELREGNNEILFIDEKVIVYDDDFKVSSLIKSIQNYKASDFDIEKDDSVIRLPNNKTVMVNYAKDEIKLGDVTFSFKYNGSIYQKKVTFIDNVAPIITCLSSYDVEKGNKYFDLENLIETKDNYTDEKNIELFFNGSYDINKVGKYNVEVLAYDEQKNVSKKNVTVNVKDEKVENDYQKPSNSNQNSSSNHSQSQNKNPSNSSKENHSSNSSSDKKKPSHSTSNYKPQSKSFTIDTYSSFEECLKACENYIYEAQRKGFVGYARAEPIQRDGLNIGYKAVFN